MEAPACSWAHAWLNLYLYLNLNLNLELEFPHVALEHGAQGVLDGEGVLMPKLSTEAAQALTEDCHELQACRLASL